MEGTGTQRREKRFAIPISGDELLHVRIVREDGTITEFAISYELFIMGIAYEPCRIDNAHGTTHVDVFDTSGKKIEQRSLGYTEPRETVPEALKHMKSLIRYHRERFLRELAEGR